MSNTIVRFESLPSALPHSTTQACAAALRAIGCPGVRSQCVWCAAHAAEVRNYKRGSARNECETCAVTGRDVVVSFTEVAS